MDNDSPLPEVIDPENIDIFLQNIKSNNQVHQQYQGKCSVPDCKLYLNFVNTGRCVLCNKDLCLDHQAQSMHRCIVKLKTIQEQNLEESLQVKKQPEPIPQQKQPTSSSFFVCCNKKKNINKKS